MNLKSWVYENQYQLFVVGTIVGFMLFVLIILLFAPGTESGAWYNRMGV